MTLPSTFANETGPGMQELDNNFLAVAAMAKTICTASGTNTITLTPNANQPTVSAYVDGAQFSFVAVNSSSGALVLGVNALAQLPIYKVTGVQAGSGDVLSGSAYVIQYIAALNSGAGGFQIVSDLPSTSTVPTALGSASGLTVTNNTSTPNTKIDIGARQALLTTTGGSPLWLSAPAVTIDLTTTGPNGMDIGARPTSGWAYCYLISNGSVTAGLATATSPTAGAPTMPSGYTYSTYVGAMRCDSSQNLLRSKQSGSNVQFVITASTNTAVVPNIDSGAKGTYSTTAPALATASITSVVPLTASRISVVAAVSWKGGSVSSVLVAPSTAWGGANNGPIGSAGQIWPLALASGIGATTSAAEMQIEATTIAWASSGAGGAIGCLGYTDGYVAA